MFRCKKAISRSFRAALASAETSLGSSPAWALSTNTAAMATVPCSTDLLARQRSGQHATTSGRPLFSNSRLRSGLWGNEAAPSFMPKPHRSMATWAENPTFRGWRNGSASRERSPSPSLQPPASAAVPPSVAGTPAVDSSGLPGLTHFSGYRTLTSTPSPGNAAQPALELPLEDPAVVAAGEALLSPPGMVTVEGIVKQVRFHSSQTGYTVMRVAISSQTNPKPLGSSPAAKAGGSKQPGAHPMRRKEVTVVGTMHHAMVGLCLKLSGEWITHPQYGEQLQAVEIVEMPPQHDMDVVAYLSGGVIPGVGHATAERLVNKFGAEILEILDSADAVGLLVGGGISRKTAEKIKSGWDSGREARIGSMFLREAGVAAALAQRVAESLGERTKEVVTCDPYAALKAFSLPLTKLDHLAATVDAPADLVSRAAAVMEHALAMAAAGEGHTFLPWDRLEQAAKDVLADLALQHGNSWERPDLLHLVAKHMHDTGTLVAEPPGACSTVDPYASPPQSQPRFDTAQAAYSHDTIEKVKQTVLARLTSASAAQLASLLEEYDTDLPNILDQPDVEAIEALVRCRRIGPKTAEKLKAQWDASAPEQGGAKTKFGTRIADLEGSPPSTPFEWTGDTKCYLPRLYAAEVGVASGAAAKASLAKPPSASRTSKIRQWILDNQDTNGLELSDGQRAAIEAASDAPILVITGGPGCGKTTVVQSIVKLWCAQGKEVKVCAPTGRAAQRMGVIQNIEPSTIHRLLKYQPRGMKGGAASTVAEDDALEGEETGFFQHGPFNRLKCDAVLVDEASMLSLPLAASLLQALRPKSQLVLVGDIDQLPPVGPGGVLHSLIASKLVPVIDLREIFRQAARSTIITSALAVRQGAVPRLPEVEPTANQLLHAGTDALLVRAPTADAVPDLVFASVAAMAGADDFKESDLQVITPMRKGPIGAGALNPRLQALLNPPGPGKAEVVRGGSHQDRVFRVGDRVLQLKNNYDKDVFNGDQGRIVRADPKMKRLVVEYPVTAGREGPDGKVTLTGDTVSKEYMSGELGQLELAYAVTVHKAQGGEAKRVVLALSPQHGRLLTRRLLYTGLTRAKELLVVVAPGGSTDPIVTAVGRQESDDRLSSLRSRLEAQVEARGLKPQTPVVFSNEDDVLGDMVAPAPMNPAAALSALCSRLGVDEPTAALLQALPALSEAPLVSVETVRTHLQMLERHRGDEARKLSVSEVLSTAPLLLVSAPESFDRCFSWCQKLGPAEGELHGDADGNNSLVDQLRRLLATQ